MTAETIAPIPVAQTPRKTGLVRRILRNPVGLVAVLVLALMGFAASSAAGSRRSTPTRPTPT